MVIDRLRVNSSSVFPNIRKWNVVSECFCRRSHEEFSRDQLKYFSRGDGNLFKN